MIDATLFFFWSDAMVDLTMVGDGLAAKAPHMEVVDIAELLAGVIEEPGRSESTSM